MLVLIAGITGNIGAHAAAHGIARGHQVRGLGRNPVKLPSTIAASLESFVTSKSYWDVSALDRACTGVDAVICAYSGSPELHLDGQLLLLRAAERAGVKRFLAASWNYDWRNINFGDEPVYDAIIAFHQQVRLTSSIRPLHIFSGMLAEVFFGVEGQAGFTPAVGGIWDPEKKYMEFWGDGEGKWNFTTEEDAGKWGVELVTAPGAEEGGFVSFCSWTSSLSELRSIYEEVRGVQVGVRCLGSVQQLEELAKEKRDKMGIRAMWDWHRLWFVLYSLKGTWNLSDLANDRFPNVTATSLQAYLEANPGI